MESESNLGFPASRGNPSNEDTCHGNVIVIEPISTDDDEFSSNQNNCIDLEYRSQQHHQQQQTRQYHHHHPKMRSILNCQSSNSPILMNALTSPIINSSSSFPSSSLSSSSTLPSSIPPNLLPKLQVGVQPQTQGSNLASGNLTPTLKPRLQSILIPPEEIRYRALNEALEVNSGSRSVNNLASTSFENKTKVLQVKMSGVNVGINFSQLNNIPPQSTDIKPFVQCSIPSVVSNNSCESDDTFIEVVCGDNTAQLNLNRLAKGTKVSCVWFKGTYITPNQFQHASGRATARDWKRSIKHSGSSLKVLMFNKTITLTPAKCRCSTCTGITGSSKNICSASSSCEHGQVFNSSYTSSPGGVNASQDSSYSNDRRLSTSTDDRDSMVSSCPMDLTYRSKPESESDDDVDMSDVIIDNYLKINEPQYLEEKPLNLSTCDHVDPEEWKLKVEFMRSLGMGETSCGIRNMEKIEYLSEVKKKVMKLKLIKERRALRNRTSDLSTMEATNFDKPLDLVLPFKKRYQTDYLNNNHNRFKHSLGNSSKTTGTPRSIFVQQEEKCLHSNGLHSSIGAFLSSECYTVNSSYRSKVNKETFSQELATKVCHNRKRNEDKMRKPDNLSSPRPSTIPINFQNLSNPFVEVTTNNSDELGFKSGFGTNGFNRHIPGGTSRSRSQSNPLTNDLLSSVSQVHPINLHQHLDIKTSVLKKQLWRSLEANTSAGNSNDLPELVTNHISSSPELEAVIKSIMHKMLTEHSYNGLTKSYESIASHLVVPRANTESIAPISEQCSSRIDEDGRESPPNLVIVSPQTDDNSRESHLESRIRMKSASENYLPDLIKSNRVDQEMTIDYTSMMKSTESSSSGNETDIQND